MSKEIVNQVLDFSNKTQEEQLLLVGRILEFLSTKAITLDLIGFQINDVGFSNPLHRVDGVLEDTFRVMNSLDLISLSGSLEELDTELKSEYSKFSKVNIRTDTGLIRFNDIKCEVNKFKLDVSQKNKPIHLKPVDIILHTLTGSASLTLLIGEVFVGESLQKINFELKKEIKDYFLMPVIKKNDLKYDFTDGLKISFNKYILNFSELLSYLVI